VALTVAQYEELLRVLGEVPILVDKLEERRTDFSDDVLAWLKLAERVLANNRLPDAAQIAAYRARLIEAGRGVQQDDMTIVGRPSARKIKEATGALVLASGNDVLQAVIADRKSVFQEAERISRQMLTLAQLKGLVTGPIDGGSSQQQFLARLRDQLAADPDLASIEAHVVGLVGATDTLVMLDRALASLG
jgi:hypothetical protein